MGAVPRNAAKLENFVRVFSEVTFASYSCKTGKCWNQIFFTGRRPGVAQVKQDMSNFDSDPLTCDTSPNNLTLLYLDSPMAKVFSATISIWFDFAHLQGKTGGQSWTKKCKFWVGVTFSINGNFQRFEKKYFCLFKYYLC